MPSSSLRADPINIEPQSTNTVNQPAALHTLLSQGRVWLGDGVSGDAGSSALLPLTSFPVAKRKESIPFYASEIDSLLPHGGLLCGAVHEFFYNDPLLHSHRRNEKNLSFPSTIPALLARNTIKSYYESPSSAWDRSGRSSVFPFFIVWIGKSSWPTPFALPAHCLRSCLFIDPPTEKLKLWAIETALRSHAVKLVVADCPAHSLTTSRRLLLAAEAHNTTAILLRRPKEITAPSSATTKWELSPTPSHHSHPLWELTLKRIKGGSLATTTWILGLEDNDEEREEVSLRVFPRMVDRSNEAQTADDVQYGT